MNCHRRSTVAPSPFARKPLAIFTALVSLGLPLTAVCADEEEQPSGATANAAPLEVGSTVVTASGFSQDVRDAPASISVITREELENKQFRSLADAVRNVEGVSIIGGDKGEISIRGMESSHVLILIDGRRQNTSQVTLKGGTSEGLGMNWIPPVEAIDRIEVVRGPMSTLYGSEALGGVINVITRKVARQWSGSVSADHTFQDSSKAGDSTQLDGYVSGPLVEDRLGIQLWGYDKQRDEDKILNGFSKSTRHSGTARLWLTPDEQQEFMLEAGRTEQEFWNNPGKSLAPTAAKNNNQYTRDTYVLAHTGNWDFGTTDISLYREEATRASDVQAGNQSVTPDVTNSVFESKISLPFDRNVFVAGAQWKKDELEADGYYASPQGAGIGTSMTEKSLFAENEWSMTDSFSLTTGIRMDDNEFFGRHWTPRFYGVWRLNPDWTLKGGVAKGFKSPTITQTNPNIGLPQRGGAYTWGNPDLKPEESENREIGLYYDAGGKFSGNVTLFDTDYENKIANTGTRQLYYPDGSPVPADPITGRIYSTYFNITGATVRGIETAARYRFNDRVQLKGEYTYLHSKVSSGDATILGFGYPLAEGQPLVATPKHSGSATLDWQIIDSVSSFATVSYRGEETSIAWGQGGAVSQSEQAITTVDVGATWQATQDLSLSLVGYNLTNQVREQDVDSDYSYAEDGRRFWVKANYTF